MTDPLPVPIAALPRTSLPSAESFSAAVAGRSGGQPTTATVLALTRYGPLIESAGSRWLVSGAPPLPQGARLSLEHTLSSDQQQPSRLLAIGARALDPPVVIRLQPVGPPASAPPPAESVPRSVGFVQVEARLVGPAGRPLGPLIAISLSVAEPASAVRAAIHGDHAAPSGPAVAPQAAAAAARPPATAVASVPTAAARDARQPLAAAPVPPAKTGVQASAGATLLAEVVERGPEGRLLLQSGEIRLRLESRLDLPLGARLQLVLPQGLPPLSATLPATAAPDPLQRMIAALLQRTSAGGEAQESAGLRVPAADHALAARLLRWVQTLVAASSAPANQSAGADGSGTASESPALRAATLELARQTHEPQPGGWRVLVMPIGVEDPQVLKIHLREPPADPEREPQPGRDQAAAIQRAIFEVELSHLGRCQLDVLCQSERFDLVVRSAAPLGAAVEDDIRSLIAATRAVAGLSGRLEFRAAELLTLPDPLLPAGRHITV